MKVPDLVETGLMQLPMRLDEKSLPEPGLEALHINILHHVQRQRKTAGALFGRTYLVWRR
jgi:hypothetical protein